MRIYFQHALWWGGEKCLKAGVCKNPWVSSITRGRILSCNVGTEVLSEHFWVTLLNSVIFHFILKMFLASVWIRSRKYVQWNNKLWWRLLSPENFSLKCSAWGSSSSIYLFQESKIKNPKPRNQTHVNRGLLHRLMGIQRGISEVLRNSFGRTYRLHTDSWEIWIKQGWFSNNSFIKTGVKFITLFIKISSNNLTWNALFNRNKYLNPIYLIKGDLTTACHQITHCPLSFPVEWINITSECWSQMNHHLSLDNALYMWEW